MVTLAYIATTFIKPALVYICILSCTLATLFILNPTKGATTMRKTYTTRDARNLIKLIGKDKARAILASHGLTLEELGIR
jgi:hypothetical protein